MYFSLAVMTQYYSYSSHWSDFNLSKRANSNRTANC